MKRNVLRDVAARAALTPEQQATLDEEETIILDPRGMRVRTKQAETRSRLQRLLVYIGTYNPFGQGKHS